MVTSKEAFLGGKSYTFRGLNNQNASSENPQIEWTFPERSPVRIVIVYRFRDEKVGMENDDQPIGQVLSRREALKLLGIGGAGALLAAYAPTQPAPLLQL